MNSNPVTRTVPVWLSWTILLVLCAIAVGASIGRLLALGGSTESAPPAMRAVNAVFAAKAALTRGHVIAGMVFAVAVPLQLSARVRRRLPRMHRWMGRVLVVGGLGIAASGYAMVMTPVGGALEVSAIIALGAALAIALLVGWNHARHRRFAQHREWMLRAIALMLGIATTRPVMGLFFATSPVTGLWPSQFFGIAFWIGFTSTALAGEWYVRRTRKALRSI